MRVLPNNSRSAGRGLQVEKLDEVDLGALTGVRYRVGECTVIQTDPFHLSISAPDRDPTWQEIAAARYALLPKSRDCAMVLPPDDEYVNVHEHCFHVFLLRDLGPRGRHHNPEGW